MQTQMTITQITKISITGNLLGGNLFRESGDEGGQYDVMASAREYARLVEQRAIELLQATYPGVEVEVDIDVQNASGAQREATCDYETRPADEYIHGIKMSALDAYQQAEGEVFVNRWSEWVRYA